jgi:hypothetical protein
VRHATGRRGAPSAGPSEGTTMSKATGAVAFVLVLLVAALAVLEQLAR